MNASVATEGLKAVIAFFTAGIGATIVLLMPGYLLNAAYNRHRRGPSPSEREFIAGSAVGAIVVHTIALVWTVPLVTAVVRHGPAGRVGQIALWSLTVLIVLPTVLGAGLGALTDVQRPRWLRTVLSRAGLSAAVRTPQAWDWVFSRGFPAYVRVRLTDGRTVHGVYSERSFASSDSDRRDLYLEQQLMQRDGWFAAAYPGTMGVWLSGDSIASIEFFDGRPAGPDDGGTDD